MSQLKPDNEVKHGKHVDKFWPGVVHSVWSLPLAELRRERTYKERNNMDLRAESWLIILRIGRHKLGLKWERDINA